MIGDLTNRRTATVLTHGPIRGQDACKDDIYCSYLGRNHADELLVRMFPLLIDVVDVTGHFLEVAGGLVDQSIESGLLWTTQRGGGAS